MRPFANGNGINKPPGILAYDTVANTSYAWGKIGFVKSGAASAFPAATALVSPADCLIDLYYAPKSGYRNGAVWLMSDATMNTVRDFKDAEGAHIWAPPSGVAEVATILGKPVHTDDKPEGDAGVSLPDGKFSAAWCRKNSQEQPAVMDPSDAQPLARALEQSGLFDFERLPPDWLPSLCKRINAWPTGMAETLDLGQLSLDEADLDFEEREAREARRRAEIAGRSITFSGTSLDTGAPDFAQAFAELAGRALASSEWLARSRTAKVRDSRTA